MSEDDISQIQKIKNTQKDLKQFFNPVKQTKNFIKIFLITSVVIVGLSLLYLLISFIGLL